MPSPSYLFAPNTTGCINHGCVMKIREGIGGNAGCSCEKELMRTPEGKDALKTIRYLRAALLDAPVRDRTCLSCGHKWVSPIRMAPSTSNLSGEATEYCGQCGRANVMSEPARRNT